ncbi:MAG: hypothetical protein E6305_04095 [Veillonella sp.]|nr:hypothetical protein [Veillonella sp.]
MNDKQFTDELFKRMYDLGYRKAEIENGTIFFYKNRECISQWSNRIDIRNTCFTKEKQQIDIAEYLGIIDWINVKSDTPILVRDSEESGWKKRHFAFFDNEMIYAWESGLTSWSIENHARVVPWKYAKLAEV